MACRQVGDDLLSNPTSVQKACPGIREAPLEVGDDATVGALGAEIVWVLQVQSLVCSTCTPSKVVSHCEKEA